MIIKEEVEIRAPLAVVWEAFSCMEDWDTWNSVCRNLSMDKGSTMSRDVCFSFMIRPYYLPIKISPVITVCDPGSRVVWAGSRLGIHAEHSFIFEETGSGVRLTSIEEFHGAMVWVSRLFFIPAKLHRLTLQLLKEIKNHAEACHYDPADM